MRHPTQASQPPSPPRGHGHPERRVLTQEAFHLLLQFVGRDHRGPSCEASPLAHPYMREGLRATVPGWCFLSPLLLSCLLCPRVYVPCSFHHDRSFLAPGGFPSLSLSITF